MPRNLHMFFTCKSSRLYGTLHLDLLQDQHTLPAASRPLASQATPPSLGKQKIHRRPYPFRKKAPSVGSEVEGGEGEGGKAAGELPQLCSDCVSVAAT